MINSVKAIVAVIILALTTSYSSAQTPKVVVVPLGGYDGPVCCKVHLSGILVSEESHKLCDTNKTLRIGVGIYRVGFSSPLNDVRSKVKLITLDTQTIGHTWGMAGVSDLVGSPDSVFIRVHGENGDSKDSGYNLCLF